ncbi:MAG: HemK/PrmC family methyltransferase [Candidatus Peribacteraceae bacterium]|jgi:release factor glutamine methyltransferase
MRIDEILRTAGFPGTETEVLLSSLLTQERTWIIAHPAYTLTRAQEARWNGWVERRRKHEPVTYITERTEFYGRPFIIRQGALVPRPATEGLVAVALAELHQPTDGMTPTDAGIVALARTLRSFPEIRTIVDVGTGSGCIAVTMALERPDLSVIATDISDAALAVARENAALHHVDERIQFKQGSLLDPVSDLLEPFLLVSNPPYVPADRELPRDIRAFEPQEAIFAGRDGLDVIRPLVSQAKEHPFCAGFVIECEETQVPLMDKHR